MLTNETENCICFPTDALLENTRLYGFNFDRTVRVKRLQTSLFWYLVIESIRNAKNCLAYSCTNAVQPL
jgi:hypothetical protein